MRSQPIPNRRITTYAGAALLSLAFAVAGCGSDDDAPAAKTATPSPVATRTSTPAPTASATASPTATHEPGPPHSIMRVGSTLPTGGALAVNTVPTAFVVETACLGGTGPSCAGGTVVYTGTSPGFNTLQADDPSLPIYKLPDGVTVSIEVTAVEPDASVTVSNVMLSSVDATAVVNTTPELHNHPVWQLVAPGGTLPEERHLTFRLLADGYAPSAEIQMAIQFYEEDGSDHEGGD